MPDYESLQITVNTLLAIAAVAVAFWSVRKIYMEAKQPTKETEKRLKALEEHQDNDNERLKDLEEMTKLTLRAQLALIDSITANGDNKLDELHAVQKEIQNYLIRR